MKNFTMKKMIGLMASMVLLTGSLSAKTIYVFVHGKSSKNHNGTGTTDVNNYWGSAAKAVSGTKYFVGYNGKTDPRTYGSARAQTNLTTVMNQRCKGADTCKIICHSAGCYATEYWLDKLGSSASRRGYKISGVTALAAASGGSELASALNGITFGFGGNAMDKSLIVNTARYSFNHNDTAGVTVSHVPGYKGMFGASLILPGEDDYAVAFHSACGYNKAGGMNRCQSTFKKKVGIWPFRSTKTYKQFSGHRRAPSLSSKGLKENHSQVKNDGWR